jgi:protein-disulfide isomerase
MIAAESSEAAGSQGKFWEMHDFLFEHQDTLGDFQVTLAFAEQLGLDVQKFELEIAQHVHQSRVKEDIMGGVRSGVNGTPTFFVNRVRHDGSPTAETIIEALESIPTE